MIYSISVAPIEAWAKDYPNGYIYFVLQEDARKIWRTDLHGQNRTLIYQSQYGDITFLKYDGRPGWLGLIENGNRCCFYNMDTKTLTVLLMPYSMEQFHYYADEQRLFWKGQLNESDTQVDLGGNTYNYYLKTGAYKMLKYNEKGTPQWVTVTPEK